MVFAPRPLSRKRGDGMTGLLSSLNFLRKPIRPIRVGEPVVIYVPSRSSKVLREWEAKRDATSNKLRAELAGK